MTNSLKACRLVLVHVSANDAKHKRRPKELLKRSKSRSTTGGSGGFCKKGDGLSSDVFRWQPMAVIGIENEAVGFGGGLEGVT